jgi:uncharacterized protein YkwD
MIRPALWVSVVAGFFLPLAVAPVLVLAPSPSPPIDRPAFATETLRLHNAARAARLRPPLALDARLTAAAQGQAEDCARRDVLSHTGTDGSTPWDRIRRAGYRYSAASENAASGWPDTPPGFPASAWGPRQAVDQFLGDGSHRRNVMGDWTVLGVGVAAARNGRRYVAVDYARP